VGASLLTVLGLQDEWLAHTQVPSPLPLTQNSLYLLNPRAHRVILKPWQQELSWRMGTRRLESSLHIGNSPCFQVLRVHPQSGLQEEYIALAVRAAQDTQQLAQLRANLRERMLASPLCDGRGFVDQLEDTYRELWCRWIEGGGQSRL
jgi:hypothetical protein